MVSIITVNYNGWQDTCELIASLKSFETYPYEVIVVDNASSGNDVEKIQLAYPEVTLVCSDKNLGFAGGNNLGYKYANGEFLFFVNNDVIIKAPILKILVERFHTNMNIGGISPIIRYYDLPHEVQYFGYQKMTHITLKHATPPYDRSNPKKYLIEREVEVMHGAAMFVSKQVVEQVGMMAECYFLYYEEFDWSYRILEKGYSIWYEPAAIIYHKEGTKKGLLLTPFREYYMVRGRVIFARRNLKGIDRVLACSYLVGIVMLRNILIYIYYRRWKSLRAAIIGTFDGLFVNVNY